MLYLRLCCIILLAVAPLLGAQDENGVLYYGDFGSLSTLEPVTASQPSELHLCQFVFDSLVIENIEGEFIFSLARDLDISPDGLSYTFILRKGLKWADGEPLTSRDIQFTLSLMSNRQTDNYNATLDQYIEDVICINPKMVTIVLARPFYSPLSLFTFKILPKHKFSAAYLKRSHPFCRTPIGCGPFQYAKSDTRQISLVPNQHCRYRRSPFLTKIVAQIYSNKKEATKQLLQRKLRLVTQLEPGDIKKIELRSKQFALKRYRSRTIYFIACNHRPQHRYHELFQDYRFRRALLHAIDRHKLLDKYFLAGSSEKRQDGQAHSVISGPFPINSWAYNDKVAPFAHNISYAQQLLKEVLTRKGYQQASDGTWKKNDKPIQLRLQYPAGDHAVAQTCQEIVANFNRLGLVVSLDQESEKQLLTKVWDKHQFDLVYTKYIFDSSMNVFPLFDPSQTGKGQSNFSGYVDSKVVELFSQLRSTLNPWVLRSISHKIHKVVHDETTHLFLWQLDLYAAHHRSLENLKLHPYYLFNFPEKWKIIKD